MYIDISTVVHLYMQSWKPLFDGILQSPGDYLKIGRAAVSTELVLNCWAESISFNFLSRNTLAAF